MSDNLVKRLRDMDGVWVSNEALVAAKRIEELEAELQEARQVLVIKLVESALSDNAMSDEWACAFEAIVREVEGHE